LPEKNSQAGEIRKENQNKFRGWRLLVAGDFNACAPRRRAAIRAIFHSINSRVDATAPQGHWVNLSTHAKQTVIKNGYGL
jgi:hypothetical protein